MMGTTDCILHNIDENNFIVGEVKFSCRVRVRNYLSVTRLLNLHNNNNQYDDNKEIKKRDCHPIQVNQVEDNL